MGGVLCLMVFRGTVVVAVVLAVVFYGAGGGAVVFYGVGSGAVVRQWC